MTIEQVFTRRLQEERKQRGWSQAELSRRVTDLGLSIKKDAMSKIESGERGVKLDEAVALAAALDVPLHALLLTDNRDDVIGLAPEVEVRMAFAAAWLAGVMPLHPEDVDDYGGVGSDVFHMALVDEHLPALLSAKPNPHEVEMARAYVARRIRNADLMQEAASEATVPPRMASEMRDVARESRDSAARVEALLPSETVWKERKR